MTDNINRCFEWLHANDIDAIKSDAGYSKPIIYVENNKKLDGKRIDYNGQYATLEAELFGCLVRWYEPKARRMAFYDTAAFSDEFSRYYAGGCR